MKQVLIAAVVVALAVSCAVAEADNATGKAKDAKAECKCIVCDKVINRDTEVSVEIKVNEKTTLIACGKECTEKVEANREVFIKKAKVACQDKPTAPAADKK